METVKSKDGVSIAYDVIGEGPALIYITGAICFRKFKPVVDDVKYFSKSHKVYTYDRRGRGDSGDGVTYAIEREVEDIGALIEKAESQVILYGHSSGAILALEAALAYPHKISKVVIYDAAYAQNELEKNEFIQLGHTINHLLNIGKNKQAIQAFLVGIGMPKVFAYLLPIMPGWKTMKALAPTLSYDVILAGVLPPLERMSKLEVPTKIIFGQKSPKSMRNVAEQLSTVIKNGELIEIDGQDHMVSAKAIVRFLG